MPYFLQGNSTFQGAEMRKKDKNCKKIDLDSKRGDF
jgi:hypothetical protein